MALREKSDRIYIKHFEREVVSQLLAPLTMGISSHAKH